MDRTKQKPKKEKPNKNLDKDKSPSFIADVKTFKENLKIREILRTVKMNNNMRIKAPRGSKVMQNKDFNDNEDIFEGSSSEGQELSEPTSATNPIVVANNIDVSEASEEDCESNKESSQTDSSDCKEDVRIDVDPGALHKSKSLSEGLEESTREVGSIPNSPVSSRGLPSPLDSPHLRLRDRKLSLDHTMLSKREGLSQSEVDLHSIGKSPLERKSSFFRKKMDSFLKNTTEIFKRQSMSSKSSVQRRGSTSSRMSVSMQSLHENDTYEDYDNEAMDKYDEELGGSQTSLRSSVTPVRSNSSLSVTQSDRLPPDQSEDDSLAGSRPALVGSQPIGDRSSNSINSLNENYAQDSLLNSRAISMSSGLDTAHGPRKRKTSRSNRVTWVASESLTDYFRRLIQDEKTKEMQVCHSYQDFSTIPENYSGPKTDSKGRRLSYQRAVSGEDPVLPSRYQESSMRRRKKTDNEQCSNDLSQILSEFTRSGVPELIGFKARTIPDEAQAYLKWAGNEAELEDHYDWKQLPQLEESRQAVIKELIHTEADYIRHLNNIVEVYIAAAHALQDADKLLSLDTSRLFLNIPDVLNANMHFWEVVMYPMIKESFTNKSAFNTDLMASGFSQLAEIFEPYEYYVCNQSKAVDYLRALSSNAEFMAYLKWCHNKNPGNRLQLADILVKPMQRLTKYSLIIGRIISYTESEESKTLLTQMDGTATSFVHRVNRAIRRKDEIVKLDELSSHLELFEVDFKDEEIERYFRMMNVLNLKAPMLRCGSKNYRNVIHQGEMRFKDHLKEIEVRAILFTDMLLICKKLTYKMIRPKYILERTDLFDRIGYRSNNQEMSGLIFVVVDEHSTPVTAFCLSEPPKDPNPQQTLRIWEQKYREARMTYEFSVWFQLHPVKDLSEVEYDYTAEQYRKSNPEEWIIERRSRERVAAMLHPNTPPLPIQEATSVQNDPNFEPGRGPPCIYNQLYRTSMGNFRNSRLSSFQQSTSSRNSRLSSYHQSTSATSHDEPSNDATKYLYKAGSSVEHLIPPQNPDDVARSITVNVVSESECETLVPSRQSSPPMLVLQQSTPHHLPGPRSASAGGSQNTLRVSPQHSLPMVHSLPDLSIEQSQTNHPSPQHQPTASEKLYQSHQELLQRNRLAAIQRQQYLSPHHRGTSYPPPSPTRMSLKRGLALSYSFRNPPLSKMGHVDSQSQAGFEMPSTSQTQALLEPVPGTSTDTSTDKADKKKQTGRSKTRGKSPSPEPSKIDQDSASAHSKGHDDDKVRKPK